MPAPHAFPAGPVPFRLIAIVSDETGIDRLYDLSVRSPRIPLGLMLRDPEHRREVVERLAAYALRLGAPPGVSLIANSFAVPGITWVHGTSAMLHRIAGRREREETMESGSGMISPGNSDTGKIGDLLAGYSVHHPAEADLVVRAGARYVTFSPVFPTSSKPGHPGAGIDALRRFCAAVPLPVFALGGITADTARMALDAGAYGIASISLFAQDSPAELAALPESLLQSSIVNRTS